MAGVAATLLAAGLGTIASPGFASASALEVDGGVLQRWVLPADVPVPVVQGPVADERAPAEPSVPDIPPPGDDAEVTAAP